ncbi:MAG: ABC transporter ATP-binding protein [Dehalococcoidia bacterium]
MATAPHWFIAATIPAGRFSAVPGTNDTHALRVSHLSKRYGEVVAVRDASFEVEPGEIFGIIGPNGAGKTTTVECLQGLRDPDQGELSVLGLDPRTQGSALRNRIGSQLQESALPDRIRVWEALDLFGALSPRSRSWASLARDWDIYEKRNSAFASLSGGQRQRLFIALALVNDPELVFLDEMTTGLDPAARRLAWDLVRAVRERGTTVVLVTHFMDEAEALCDRIAVFRHGDVVAVDTPAGLIERVAAGSTVTFTADDSDLPWLAEVPGVDEVSREGTRFAVSGRGPLLAHVASALVARGIAPLDLDTRRATLEDAFMELSGGDDAA